MSTGSRSRSRSPVRSSGASAVSAATAGSPSKGSNGSTSSLGMLSRATGSLRRGRTHGRTQKRTVGYAWVSVAADLDFEGGDVRDSLGALVGMAEEGTIRPWVGNERDDEAARVVPLDKAPEVIRRDGDGPVGPLKDGGTCVVRIIP